jgi:hypothetical protein
LNAEIEAGLEGCTPVVPGSTCAKTKPGSDEKASAAGNHRQCAPARRRFNPLLKSSRSPNADLIIIETEIVVITGVFAVEVIDADTQPSINQHVKGRFDKIVIILSGCIHTIFRGQIIGILIPDRQTEVNTPEQTLLNSAHNIGRPEILIGKKSRR